MAKWTIERIREEIARLDEMTGLNGRSLDITIGNAKYTLGSFHFIGTKPTGFRFSAYFFERDDFSESEALNLIRHEYAHYMDLVLNGNAGDRVHGESWKACCRRIGARPTRCFSEVRNQSILRHENAQKMAREETQRAVARFAPGTRVRHPAYGEGVVQAVSGDGTSARADVLFDPAGVKTLGIGWMQAHCPVIEPPAAQD